MKDVHEKGILAVDGKVSRDSGRKEAADGPVKAMQMLNVYSCDTGICIGHKPIGEKTNEIPAAQEILGLMELKGMIVTADAMNCQKETAEVIHEGKGEYVLSLKGNQGLFYEEVKEYFDEECLAVLRGEESSYKKTVEAEHGGTAVREYYITEETGWFSEKKLWKGLRSFGVVHKKLKKADGSSEEETRYYICSIGEDAEEFERASRGALVGGERAALASGLHIWG